MRVDDLIGLLDVGDFTAAWERLSKGIEWKPEDTAKEREEKAKHHTQKMPPKSAALARAVIAEMEHYSGGRTNNLLSAYQTDWNSLLTLDAPVRFKLQLAERFYVQDEHRKAISVIDAIASQCAAEDYFDRALCHYMKARCHHRLQEPQQQFRHLDEACDF